MKKYITINMVALLFGSSAFAFTTDTPAITGAWYSINPDTGLADSEITLSEKNGILSGVVTKGLRPDSKSTDRCIKCKDDRKDKPILGMEIVRNMRMDAKKPNVWFGGQILNPEDGGSYRLTLTVKDKDTLEMRGHWGIFSGKRTWVRTMPVPKK